MNTKTRNEFAAYGLEMLKRSVLGVLYQAYRHGERSDLTYNDIHEALGIERFDEVYGAKVRDYFVHGILIHLRVDRDVEVVGRDRHQITKKGILVIEG